MKDEKELGRIPKGTTGASYNQETRYFSVMIHFMILFLVLMCILLNVFVPEGPQRFNVLPKEKFRETDLANVKYEYSKWALPKEFLQELWDFVQKSPKNPSTNRHELMFTVVNKGQVDFSENWFCSLKRTNPKKNSFVIIALDEESYKDLKKLDAPTIRLRSNFTKKSVNNMEIVDFYDIVKIRPTILHQLLMWNCETILSDSDIVFFSDPHKLFTGGAEFEAQSDSKEFFDYKPYEKKNPLFWKVNLGFYKVIPTPGVLSLMKEWLVRCYLTPKLVDQSALKRILTENCDAYNDNDGVLSEHTEHGKIKIRILDPMLAVNAGGIYLDGKEASKNEAKRRNINVPVLCHFFHLGRASEKKKLMVDNNQWFVKNGKCVLPHGNPFPAWNG